MKLFIVLMLLTSSAFARELVCNLNEGSNREIQRTDIVEDGVTELKFENRAGATVSARAQYETVTLTVDVDGNTFKTSDSNEVELNYNIIGKEPMSISCRITRDPIYCSPK
ncbi:MAG: hypothetical protein ACJ76H_04900 [Bacteriovoracaceae bacterium]